VLLISLSKNCLKIRANEEETDSQRELGGKPPRNQSQKIGRMIESGDLEAYKLRERGAWHVFLDSVEALEKRIGAKYFTRPTQSQKQHRVADGPGAPSFREKLALGFSASRERGGIR
jgi:hypothetical protein